MATPVASPEAALSAEALRLARQALREHPGCFWTRQPGTTPETVEDARLIVRRLRQNGRGKAWQTARVLEACL